MISAEDENIRKIAKTVLWEVLSKAKATSDVQIREGGYSIITRRLEIDIPGYDVIRIPIGEKVV